MNRRLRVDGQRCGPHESVDEHVTVAIAFPISRWKW